VDVALTRIYISTQDELPEDEDNNCAILALFKHSKALVHDHFYRFNWIYSVFKLFFQEQRVALQIQQDE